MAIWITLFLFSSLFFFFVYDSWWCSPVTCKPFVVLTEQETIIGSSDFFFFFFWYLHALCMLSFLGRKKLLYKNRQEQTYMQTQTFLHMNRIQIVSVKYLIEYQIVKHWRLYLRQEYIFRYHWVTCLCWPVQKRLPTIRYKGSALTWWR